MANVGNADLVLHCGMHTGSIREIATALQIVSAWDFGRLRSSAASASLTVALTFANGPARDLAWLRRLRRRSQLVVAGARLELATSGL